jgi:hypothetical protein
MSVPSHSVKFHRAGKHLNDLDEAFVKWIHEGHHTHRLEPDPEMPHYLLIKASASQVPADPFSVFIGDAVQNFRSCLDHLAFALMCAHTKPIPEQMARDSQFPIIGDMDRKGQSGQGASIFQSQGKCIIGISPAARAVIERLQPYQRGPDFRSDPLWRLSELSNIDKHRILHVVTSYLHEVIFDPFHNSKWPALTYPNARAVSFELTGATVTQNTLIGRIRIERTAVELKRNVEVQLTPSMAFADGALVTEDVLDTLREIQTHIGGYVLAPLAAFL